MLQLITKHRCCILDLEENQDSLREAKHELESMREDLLDIVDVTKQQQQQRARPTHKNESVATKHRSYAKRIGLQFTKR